MQKNHKVLICILAMILGGLWFELSMHVTATQPVRTCCDSVNYIDISNGIHSLKDALSFSGDRTLGYPVYLAFVRVVTRSIPIFGSDWILNSEILSLLLYWAALLFFLYEFSRTTSISFGLWPLSILCVGIVGFAAAPLSDVFCIAVLIFAFGCILKGNRLDSTRRIRLFANALAGTAFGLTILIRPSLLLSIIPTVLFLSVVQSLSFKNGIRLVKSNLALGLMTLLFFFLSLSPQVVSCKNRYGSICVQSPQFVNEALLKSISIGFRSPKLTGRFYPAPILLIFVDPFMDRHFGSETLDPHHTQLDFIKIMIKKAFYVPLFFAKKMVGAFDNTDISGFGAGVTPVFAQVTNQAFGLLGFVGFFAGIFYVFVDLKKSFKTNVEKRDMLIKGAPFIFATLYLFSLLPFHIESRYSFPAWPFCVLALFLTFNKKRSITFILFGFFFAIQIYIWKDLILVPYP